MRRTISHLFLLLCLISCEELDLTGSATINSVPFVPEQVSITDTGTGVQVVLKRNVETITIWLTEKKSGNFSVVVSNENSNQQNPSDLPDGFAVGEYINENGIFYFGVSGSVTIDFDKDEVRGSFSLNAETLQDDEVAITGGRFQGILGQPKYSGCRVASIAHGERGMELAYKLDYGYGANGELVSVQTQDSPDYVSHLLVSYSGTSVAHIKRITSLLSCTTFNILYDGDKISTIKTQLGNEMYFEYGASGKTVNFGYVNGGEFPIIYAEDGNVKNVGSLVYEAYDGHPNYSQLFLEALQNQPALLTYFGPEFMVLPTAGSKNNPLQIGTGVYASMYQYEYGSNQYPVKRIETNMPSNSSSALHLTYRKCR
ncbi:MAG: hypothetical protein JNM57_15090 [Cyclobacteriaceae bacterium]|nr:hypothetical protein [Cyclobacteriaceae bacterium]